MRTLLLIAFVHHAASLHTPSASNSPRSLRSPKVSISSALTRSIRTDVERLSDAMQRKPAVIAERKPPNLSADAQATLASLEKSLTFEASPIEEAPEEESSLLLWQLALVGITACWGANFAVTSYALEALGGGASEGGLFVASRFVAAAVVLLPFLASASSAGAVLAGAQVGGLCAFGYAAQAASLGMGTAPGTAAFICSLQSVVVALMTARATGGVAARTWLAVGLSVAGVGCLELPSVLEAASASAAAAAASSSSAGPCLGDLVAFGQPLGFGLSYIVLGRAMEEHPDDELPLAALQCAVIAAAAVGAACVGGHQLPTELPWAAMLPDAASAAAIGVPSAPWGVPLAIAYTGLISTAATIWLTAKVFKRLPPTDASLILASEPLWATLFAALLLGEQFGEASAVGGGLILSALACNEGFLDGVLPERFRAAEESSDA